MRKKTKDIAFCGILGALSVALMLLGGITGIATYAAPILASLLLIAAKEESGTANAFLLYAIVTILSLFLCTDKEAAALYLCFGYYPIIREYFGKIKYAALRIMLKFLYFNLIIIGLYLVLTLALMIPSVQSDFAMFSGIMFAGFALLLNAVAVFVDIIIPRFKKIYIERIRTKLFLRG